MFDLVLVAKSIYSVCQEKKWKKMPKENAYKVQFVDLIYIYPALFYSKQSPEMWCEQKRWKNLLEETLQNSNLVDVSIITLYIWKKQHTILC